MNKNEILNECTLLYHDIDKCITNLVKARLNNDSSLEQKTCFEMEKLMIGTLQDLTVIMDYIENKNMIQNEQKFNKVEFIKKTIDWIVTNYGDYYDSYGEYFNGLEMAEDLQHYLEKEI
jgi:hypothetical protein